VPCSAQKQIYPVIRCPYDIPIITNVDSLERLLPRQQAFDRLKTMIALERSFQIWYPRRFGKYQESILKLATQLNAPSGLAWYYILKEELEENAALRYEYLKKALTIFQTLDYEEGMGITYNKIAGAISALDVPQGFIGVFSDVDKGEYYNKKAKEIAIKYQNPELLTDITTQETSIVAIKTNDTTELNVIKKKIEKTLLYVDKNPIVECDRAALLFNLAMVAFKKRDFQSALKYMEDMFNITTQFGKNMEVSPNVYNAVASANYQLRYYEKALMFSDKSIYYASLINNPIMKNEAYISAFNRKKIIYQSQNQHKEALQMADSLRKYQSILTVKSNNNYRDMLETIYQTETKEKNNKLLQKEKELIEINLKLSQQANLKKEQENTLLQNEKLLTEYQKNLLYNEKELKDSENKSLSERNNLIYTQNRLYKLLMFIVFAFLLLTLGLYLKLKQSNNKLLQLNQVKDKLFTIVAHDLKQPALAFQKLGSTIHYLVKKNDIERLEQVGKYASVMSSNLHLTIENLFRWGTLQQNQVIINAKDTDVHSLMMNVYEEFEPLAHSKDIKLSLEVPNQCHTVTDCIILTTILRNLLSNAIKFTSAGKDIKIEAHNSDQNLMIQVKDSGIGIPTEIQKDLFGLNPSKKRNGTSQEHGSGLGLMLCKQLAELAKIRLAYDSTEGVGTTFNVTV
jgi:signal transduction histidine kinase